MDEMVTRTELMMLVSQVIKLQKDINSIVKTLGDFAIETNTRLEELGAAVKPSTIRFHAREEYKQEAEYLTALRVDATKALRALYEASPEIKAALNEGLK